jgi:hypothetical protein
MLVQNVDVLLLIFALLLSSISLSVIKYGRNKDGTNDSKEEEGVERRREFRAWEAEPRATLGEGGKGMPPHRPVVRSVHRLRAAGHERGGDNTRRPDLPHLELDTKLYLGSSTAVVRFAKELPRSALPSIGELLLEDNSSNGQNGELIRSDWVM